MNRSGADIKAGDILRHVFSYQADLGRVDYVIVYFSKVKQCMFLPWTKAMHQHKILLVLGFGGQKANEVVISRLRIKSLEDSVV